MFSKFKKYFFSTVFGILYLMFAVQVFVAVHEAVKYGFNSSMFGMSILAFEWLALMGARFLSKKVPISGANNDNNRDGRFNRNRR